MMSAVILKPPEELSEETEQPQDGISNLCTVLSEKADQDHEQDDRDAYNGEVKPRDSLQSGDSRP